MPPLFLLSFSEGPKTKLNRRLVPFLVDRERELEKHVKNFTIFPQGLFIFHTYYTIPAHV